MLQSGRPPEFQVEAAAASASEANAGHDMLVE
jgi:hypothetical protein